MFSRCIIKATFEEGVQLWSLTMQHSFIATITFLAKKGNSDLCCKDFQKPKFIFKAPHEIASCGAIFVRRCFV